MSNVREQIRHFLQVELARDLTGVDDAASLLQGGVLDSLGVMELVAFLQAHFHLDISDDDLVPENLESIDAIAGFVGRLQNEPARS
jgi:acyl carrier protein